MTRENAKTEGPETRSHAAATRLVLFGPLAAASMIIGDLLDSFMTPDYSLRSQAISELVARGAAQKALVDVFFLAFHLAVGLLLALRSNRSRKSARSFWHQQVSRAFY